MEEIGEIIREGKIGWYLTLASHSCTGTQGNYSAIAIYHDGPHDRRQVTYGRSQTTEYAIYRNWCRTTKINHLHVMGACPRKEKASSG